MACALVFVAVLAADLSAQNLNQKRFGKWHRGLFGFRAGVINATTLQVDDRSFDTNVALTAGVLFDFPLTKSSYYGFTADLLDIQVFDERQKALDVGMTFKYAVYKRESMMALKPGLGVGYSYLARIGFLDASGYLTLKMFLEATFYSNHKYAWLADFDILWAPVGGNGDYDVTFGPAIMARFGLVL